MAKKLNLDDLKVQSFVTTLNAQEAGQLVGGTYAATDCVNCPTWGTRACGGCTAAGSNCCTGGETENTCNVYSECGCTLDTSVACCYTQDTSVACCGTLDTSDVACCG